VQSTLGPGGKNVAIDPWKPDMGHADLLAPQPIITKDGVTVAQNIDLLNHGALQNIGAKLLIDAAAMSNEESGDGTTSTTVIAAAILKHG